MGFMRDLIQRVIVRPTTDPGQRARLAQHNLRPGMWVVDKKDPSIRGIVVRESVGIPGHIDVMLTDEYKGENRTMASLSSASIKQASHSEIPKLRRPERVLAARLGYLP